MLVSRSVYVFSEINFAVVIGSSLKGNIVTENQDVGSLEKVAKLSGFRQTIFFSSFLKKGRSNQPNSITSRSFFWSNFEFLFVSWNGHVLCFWLMGCEVSSAKLDKKLDKSYHRF